MGRWAVRYPPKSHNREAWPYVLFRVVCTAVDVGRRSLGQPYDSRKAGARRAIVGGLKHVCDNRTRTHAVQILIRAGYFTGGYRGVCGISVTLMGGCVNEQATYKNT